MTKAALLIPIEPGRRRQFFGGWIAVILLFVALNIIYFTDDLNPDWKSYLRLFEEDGAWLADRGRDPGFVFLIDILKSVGNYEQARILFGTYFLIFTAWFLCRWKQHLGNNTVLWSFAGLLPLLIPKYTVQIREGLAQTLVLLAFTLLYERERRLKLMRATWPAFLLLGLAGTIHGSTLLFFLATLIPFSVHYVFRFLSNQITLRISATLSAIGIAIASFTVNWDEIALDAASAFLGDLSNLEAETNSFKVIYWGGKCLLVFYLMGQVNKIAPQLVVFGNFMRYTTYVIIPALQLIVLYLVFSGYPGFISSAAIRAYHTAFYVVFALVSLTTRTTPVNFFIATALLLDEYRVMTTSDDN
jgi:hypothetical protein